MMSKFVAFRFLMVLDLNVKAQAGSCNVITGIVEAAS